MNGRDGGRAGEVRFGGVDWSWERHAVCILDAAGAVVERFEAEHCAAGLSAMTRRLRRPSSAAGGQACPLTPGADVRDRVVGGEGGVCLPRLRYLMRLFVLLRPGSGW